MGQVMGVASLICLISRGTSVFLVFLLGFEEIPPLVNHAEGVRTCDGWPNRLQSSQAAAKTLSSAELRVNCAFKVCESATTEYRVLQRSTQFT